VTEIRPSIELRAIERDSEPAIISDVSAPDTVTLQLTFDKPIDPTQRLEPALIRVQRSDSTELQVTAVQSKAEVERLRADSTRRADSLRAAAQPPLAAAARPPTTPAPPPARLTPPVPKPTAPPPTKVILVRLALTMPLASGQTYRVTARGVRNLVGYTREVTRTFTMPKLAPPDTARKAPPDTARKPPPDSVRRPPPPGRPPP